MKTSLLLSLVLAPLPALFAAPSPAKPNVICIMADELGYYDQVHAHTYYPPYLIRTSEEPPG